MAQLPSLQNCVRIDCSFRYQSRLRGCLRATRLQIASRPVAESVSLSHLRALRRRLRHVYRESGRELCRWRLTVAGPPCRARLGGGYRAEGGVSITERWLCRSMIDKACRIPGLSEKPSTRTRSLGLTVWVRTWPRCGGKRMMVLSARSNPSTYPSGFIRYCVTLPCATAVWKEAAGSHGPLVGPCAQASKGNSVDSTTNERKTPKGVGFIALV
jgi:hypothetical protein